MPRMRANPRARRLAETGSAGVRLVEDTGDVDGVAAGPEGVAAGVGLAGDGDAPGSPVDGTAGCDVAADGCGVAVGVGVAVGCGVGVGVGAT
jgi:hypothetical protein